MKEYGHLNLSKDRWVLEVMIRVDQKLSRMVLFGWMEASKKTTTS
jgi:hypothetical protein